MEVLLYTILTLCALGVLSAVILYFVAQKFRVEEDPRIDEVEKMLPGANCGGCGFAGCRGMADALVKQDDISALFCPVGGGDCMKAVAAYLGKSAAGKGAARWPPCAAAAPARSVPAPTSTTGPGRAPWRRRSMWARRAARSAASGSGTASSVVCLRRHPHQSRDGASRSRPRQMYGLRRLREGVSQNDYRIAQEVAEEPGGVRVVRVEGQGRRGDEGLQGRVASAAASAQKVCAFGAITVENNLAYIDPQKCKLCRKCVNECPTGAIRARRAWTRCPRPRSAPAAPAAPPLQKAWAEPAAGP